MGLIFLTVGILLLGVTIILRRLVTEQTSRYFFIGPASFAFLGGKPVFQYYGEVKLPKKVYIGDSHNILIDLRQVGPPYEHILIKNLKQQREIVLQSMVQDIARQSGQSEKLLLIRPDKETTKYIHFNIRLNTSQMMYFEVELQAAALTVDGERKQRKLLAPPKDQLLYRWNCYFPNSGNHIIALNLRIIDTTKVIELGAIQHKIKVVQLDHLTQRQVWMFASIAAIAGFIATVIGIVTNIPTLLHLFAPH